MCAAISCPPTTPYFSYSLIITKPIAITALVMGMAATWGKFKLFISYYK